LVKRDVRDLDDGGRLLWIYRTKTVAAVRRLNIPDELRVLLLRLAEGEAPDAPLFTRDDGSRATRHWAYHHVKRICREAKVLEQAPRRTQSDLAKDAGVVAVEIARHLGQTSTCVTDRSYRHRNVVADAQVDRTLCVLSGGCAA
jgi:integrase